jgi:predicted AAA+ superfamily ATPase
LEYHSEFWRNIWNTIENIIIFEKNILMKNRIISNTLIDKSNSRFGRIIVITGARQTGKTTLVKQIFHKYNYISIEDPVTVEQYKSLTAAQWETTFPKAILDEIQKEPQLIESIKSVYDQFPEPRYILLGSSQIMLLKNIRESLAGRCQIVEMFPLTLPEMLTNSWEEEVQLSWFQNLILNREVDNTPFLLDEKHAAKLKAFNKYLQFGGYPAISGNDIAKNEKYNWLSNYVKTYLERDIRDLAELRNLEPFAKTQKLMAINTAQLINNSQIGAEAGVTSKTVQRFIEYMSISYQILVLQPWSRNLKKRLVKSPKIHFTDVGVMRAILQKYGELSGHEFESAIVAEIYKQLRTIFADTQFYHLRTSDGREVDLLIETEAGYIAIEIKKTKAVRSVDARHFRNLDDILDKPVLHKFVISNDLNIKDLGNSVLAIPAVKFLT